MPTNEILALAMFASFIVLVFSGFPVAWILGGLSVIFTALAIVLEADFNVPIGMGWEYTSLTVDRIWNVMENWVMVALPMFIFMGLLLDRSGMANQLMISFSRLFGGIRGGLAVTVTLIGLLLAATTGIIGASVVLLALLGLPVMMSQGYDRSLASGTVCAVGTLGILIPPSIMLVLMADRMSMSVGDLFLGAVFPGVLLGGLYVAYILGYGFLKPEGIFLGLATPTEAAGVGAAGAWLLAAINRRLGGGVMKEVLEETTRTTAFIFAVLLGATAFSLVLRGLGGDQLIEDVLLGLPFDANGIVICILIATFLLGFFLDWIELTLIILPLVSPVVANLGFDPVWFTVLFAVCLQTSFLTPPVGFAIFYLKGVAPAGIDVRTIYRGVVPFILLQLLGLVILFNWRSLVTWLPAQAYGP
ncbi:MAG: TRAP transporter large permease subunit [Gammaproteobacteria bacterium]